MTENNLQGLVVVDEEFSDYQYGWNPYERPIGQLLNYGVLCVDKPAGPTSHEVVAWVRRILNIKKAGHSGTLDPMVTGLLPIGIGESTKALSTLLVGKKEYYAIARLHGPVETEKLTQVFNEFTGEIYQRPPQRSAVKRVTRTRTIYALEIMENDGTFLLLRVLCEAGTYVRKLIYDIGEVIGPGATMIELRRSQVSHLNEKNGLLRLHDLVNSVHFWKDKNDERKIRLAVKPVEYAVSHMKAVVIRDSAVDAICNGAKLAIPGVLKLSKDIVKEDTVCMYTLKGELIAIGTAEMSTVEIVEAEKGIAFLTDRVIMQLGTYPRMWKKKDKAETSVAGKH